MLTATTLTPDLTLTLGRSGHDLTEIPTSTLGSINQQGLFHQQQVEGGDGQFLSVAEINHWTPADCTALLHAFLASFSVILVSELGDKTFIITAIMAMKNSRALVFIASALALLIMTILSVGMGVAVTVIPKVYTHYASIVLFLCFGLKMLKEAYDLGHESEESEFDEVRRSLEENVSKSDKIATNPEDLPEGGELMHNDKEQIEETIRDNFSLSCVAGRVIEYLHVAPIVIKVFTMIFVAEWGDRSQISTVILAAREDVVGVFVGSFVGHVLCTGLAVIGGRFIADMISVRTSK